MRRILIIIIVLHSINSSTQVTNTERQITDAENERFYSECRKVKNTTASKDIIKAMYLADSLYVAAANDYQKVRSLLLKAHLYTQVGEEELSIKTAHIAEEMISNTNLYALKSHVAGFLSSRYKFVGLREEEERYWQISFNFSKQIENKSEYLRIQGLLYQTKGLSYYSEKKIEKALQYLNKSEMIFNGSVDVSFNDLYCLAQNEFYIARCFYDTKKIDSAGYYYTKSLKNFNLSNFDDAKFTNIIKLRLAEINHTGKKDLLEKTTAVINAAVQSKSTTMFVEGFGTLKQLTSDNIVQDSVFYHKEAMKFSSLILDKNNKAVNYRYSLLNKEKDNLSKKNKIIGSSFVIITVIFIIHFSRARKNKKRELEQFRKIISQLSIPEKELLPISETSQIEKKQIEFFSQKTEEELLKKLERFEKSTKFTNKNISLSLLAGMLQTNPRYLSYLIKKNKNKNFNEYIQELRVNYIIRMMNEDPQYLDYKISYMADEAGFSSHSNFTVIFKKYTGMKPSVFMEYLRNEKDKTA